MTMWDYSMIHKSLILPCTDGPIVTYVKALLTPAKMQNLKVKVSFRAEGAIVKNCYYRCLNTYPSLYLESIYRAQRVDGSPRSENCCQGTGESYCWS